MTRIHRPTLAACTLALLALCGTAQAQEKTWSGSAQNWSWSAEPQCKLRLDQISQPNAGQPLHVTATNTSKVRLQYTLQVRVLRSGKEVFKDSVLVDNANPGERSLRPTGQALQGALSGASVRVALTACSVRS